MRLAPLALAASFILAPGLAPAQDGDARTVGVWRITCETGLCQGFINLEVAEEMILSLSLMRDSDSDAASLLLRAPTGTALPPGIRIWPSEDAPIDVPFQVCGENDCLAVLVLTDEIRAALADLDQMRVAYFMYGEGTPRVFDAPVTGTEDALGALAE